MEEKMTRKSILALVTGIGLVFTSTVFGLTKHYETKLHNQKIILDNTKEEVYNRDVQIEELQKNIDKLEIEMQDLHDTLQEQQQKNEELSNKQVHTMEITHYTHTGNPTASGKYPVAGRTCASNDFPIGTKLRIDGNVYTVEDTGAMGSGVIDLFVDSYNEAIQKGRYVAEVEVL